MAVELSKILSVVAVLSLVGCGVRGRPQPPLTPPELGRGEPTFKRATEDLAFPEVPAPEATPDPNKRSTGETD